MADDVVKLPQQTSHWTESEDTVASVYKLFKVRTCVFDVETILWPANEHGTNLDNYFDSSSHKTILSKKFYDVYFHYLDKVFEKLDIDERSWYANAQEDLEEKAESMFALILKAIRDYKNKPPPLDDCISRELENMNERINDWLFLTRKVLLVDPAKICETTFEELFRNFVRILGLSCYRGDYFSKLTFQYEDNKGDVHRKVFSKPDLLICRKNGFLQGSAVAIAEVKNNVPLLEYLKKVRGGSGAAATSEDETKVCLTEKDMRDCALLKTNYPNGSPRVVTKDKREIYSLFLPQLIGDLVAAVHSPHVNLQSVPLHHVPVAHPGVKSVIGFGVVGFNVYIVNLLSVRRDFVNASPNWSMHQIPQIDGLGTDILISKPLHLLKRTDRNKLFKVLSAMNNLDYV